MSYFCRLTNTSIGFGHLISLGRLSSHVLVERLHSEGLPLDLLAKILDDRLCEDINVLYSKFGRSEPLLRVGPDVYCLLFTVYSHDLWSLSSIGSTSCLVGAQPIQINVAGHRKFITDTDDLIFV